jgi:putative heme-binding domain-containing protein
VNFATGPDGALYVVDMYREHVEHPQWIPLSTQREINVRAGDDRGRIYRVRRRNKPPETAVHLAQASAAQLVGYLSDANGWVRDTAQRLLVERQDLKTAPALGKLVETGPSPQARVQAMWTLEGLQALDDETIRQALADEHPRVREQALRLSERWLEHTPSLVSTVLAMADDPDPRVRFQLTLTVGSLDSPQATAVLAVLARRDAASPWHRAALLTARGARESSLISALVDGGDEFPGGRELVRDLSGVVGSRRQADEVADLVARVDRSTGGRPTWWQAAVLDGLAEGLRNRRGDAIALDGTEDVLVRLLTGKSNELVRATRRLAAHLRLPDRASMRRVLAEARDLAADPDRETSERVEAVWLAANRPFDQVRSDLVALMRPQQPPDLQTAAALALLEANPAEAFSLVLDQWSGLSPPVRGQVVDRALSTRSGREGLLAAIEAGRVLPAELSLAQRTSLLTDSDSGVRSRAEAMLAHVENEDRKRVVEENLGLLSLDSNGARGWQVFRENCGTCHQLENAGRAVGPDLTSVRNHPKRVLLEHILNPSHVIEPSFLTYVVETADGRLMTGMIRSETGQAITLVTSDGTEQTVLREDIEAITSTGKSLMPEGLERNIPQQGLADLIAFLRGE